MEREELSWIEPQPEVVATTWNQNGNNNTNNNNNNNISAMNPSDPNTVFHLDSHLPSLKSMLEGDWYMNNNNLSDQNDAYHLDSSSCFLPPFESCFSPFSNDTTTTTTTINNPFHNNFESFTPFQATNSHVLMGFSAQMTTLNKSESAQLAVEQHAFGPSNAALIPNGPNVLRPLQSIPLVGAPPSLFQKRVTCSSGADDGLAPVRFGEEGEVEGGLNNDYDDDHEVIEIFNSYNAKNSVNNKSNNNNHGNDDNDMADGEDQKGKKKGMPAKNVLIERRRRKKLNDSMFMLRSIVPKISKMDKASILRDAIDYLKELVTRINDLQLSSLGSSPCTSFHPVSVTPTLPTRVKKEICLNSTLSPKNQSPKVEVRVRDGRNVSIHMFCARRPGLFLSAMRALDGLGLDVQHAVISCFNGFSLDVFKAEQCKESQDVPPERIKTVLLDTAGFHGI